MSAYLVTYRPLCRTRAGREACTLFEIPPFVDGSCRREPDLQSEFPSISALCRAGQLAPRLNVGDTVAYVTKLGRYGEGIHHWRLTALLEVSERFDSHGEAAAWYRERGLSIPANCVVPSNPPLPLRLTDAFLTPELRRATLGRSPRDVVRVWDKAYQRRAAQWGSFRVCTTHFLELHEPPRIDRIDWMEWFGGVPPTRAPFPLSPEHWRRFERLSGSRS